MTIIFAADLFCGAGGSSNGLRDACKELGLELELVAVNHWDVAIATHSANHPGVQHYNSDLNDIDPRKVVPSGKLDLLVASPECTHFSRARGGRPRSKQSRASVKYVIKWINNLDVENVLIENVPDFMTWGPLHRQCSCGVGADDNAEHARGCLYGTPIKSRKGEYFRKLLAKFGALGYSVGYRVLNAANYGDPTTRERLFIIARKGNRKVVFPEPTHTSDGARTLFGKTKKWRTAREIIDWSVPGESIFNRQKPLSPNTLKRIEAGLRKFGGAAFVIGRGHKDANGAYVYSTERPLPTVTTQTEHGVVEPFILTVRGGNDGYTRASSIDAPLPTVVSAGAMHALVEPFVLGQQSDAAPRSVDQPLPTVAGKGAIALVEPFIVSLRGTGADQLKSSVRSVDQPLPTVMGNNNLYVAEPFLVKTCHGDKANGLRRVHSLEKPMPTVTGSNNIGLVIPELDGAVLDIRFRMLQPHELAAAMSFPKKYKFVGTREQRVKQIGNAVPSRTAKALCRTLLNLENSKPV